MTDKLIEISVPLTIRGTMWVTVPEDEAADWDAARMLERIQYEVDRHNIDCGEVTVYLDTSTAVVGDLGTHAAAQER